MFEWKGPAFGIGEFLTNRFEQALANFTIDYIAGFPVMIGMALGVWGLLQMVNKKLASAGSILVFVYGALVVIA